MSAGCANCYAETLSGRNPGTLGVWGPNGTRVVASESMWKEPAKWNKKAGEGQAAWERAVMSARSEYDAVEPYERPRVFVASLADVFEDWDGLMHAADGDPLYVCNGCSAWRTMDKMCCGPTAHYPLTMRDVRLKLLVMAHNFRNLDWLLLTKRPENVLRMTEGVFPNGWPANIWLGTSVENQQAADERIPHLLRVPAAVRFLSCEPLLGPVTLPFDRVWCRHHHRYERLCMDESLPCFRWQASVYDMLPWVIAGGESGPDARPMHPNWARSLRDQCQAAGVAFHFKQWGEVAPYDNRIHGQTARPGDDHIGGRPLIQLGDATLGIRIGKKNAGRLLDGRTWDEVPCPSASN